MTICTRTLTIWERKYTIDRYKIYKFWHNYIKLSLVILLGDARNELIKCKEENVYETVACPCK